MKQDQPLYSFRIPVNFDEDTGFLGGLIKKRNLIETFILGMFNTRIIGPWILSFSSTKNMFAFVLIVLLPLHFFVLLGIRGMSFTEYLYVTALFLADYPRSKMRYERIDYKYGDWHDDEDDEDDEDAEGDNTRDREDKEEEQDINALLKELQS